MKTLRVVSLFAVAAVAAVAQFKITSVTNGAGYIPAGLPGGGIAQGAMFVVKGSNIGPASVAIASGFPLPTTLSGTSVQVTVGGRTESAIMYYTGTSQLAAILPSSTPLGAGTLTVTYNGQVSAALPITVVASGFSMFTVNQAGSGDAIAFLNSDNGLITPAHSAAPGDVVVFWGTGLGAIAGDETNAAPAGDMTNVPLEVFIGGKPATVLYHGRNACCSSVDTVYVTVPAGISGCLAPVIMKIGNVVSNGASIAVADNGRACAPTNPGLVGIDFGALMAKGAVTLGGISLNRTVARSAAIMKGDTTVGGGTVRTDTGSASFLRMTTPPSAASLDVANFGACTVNTYTPASGVMVGPAPAFLDAGDSISVAGPRDSKDLHKVSSSGYLGYMATLDTSGTYLGAGLYTASGLGGDDIGSFSAQIALPQALAWTNQDKITTVDRSAGVTVNWTAGDPGGYVQIMGTSFLGMAQAPSAVASFTCTAKTTDGSFTVPSYVLQALPPSGTESQDGVPVVSIFGSLSVGSTTTVVPFTASGLDVGTVRGLVTNSSQVTYQ
jgi:uncharacterized protein (TIGR03437 family)